MPNATVDAAVSEEPPEPEPQKNYPVLSAEYKGPLEDPVAGATYYSFQGRKDADGTVWYKSDGLGGDSSTGVIPVSTGWTTSTGSVPPATVVDIDLDLAEQN